MHAVIIEFQSELLVLGVFAELQYIRFINAGAEMLSKLEPCAEGNIFEGGPQVEVSLKVG